MTLILEIAAAYVLGRAVCDIGSAIVKVVVRRLVESSPVWQGRIRADVERDRMLRDKVTS